MNRRVNTSKPAAEAHWLCLVSWCLEMWRESYLDSKLESRGKFGLCEPWLSKLEFTDMGRPIIGLKQSLLMVEVFYEWLTCPGHATDLVCPPVWVWASSVLLGSVLDRSFSAPGNRGDTLEAGHRRTEVIQPGEGGSSLNLSVRGKLQWKLNWCQSEILHSQGHCPQALTFILCPSQRPPPYVHKTLCTMSKCVHLNNEHVTYKVECWWQFNYKMD